MGVPDVGAAAFAEEIHTLGCRSSLRRGGFLSVDPSAAAEVIYSNCIYTDAPESFRPVVYLLRTTIRDNKNAFARVSISTRSGSHIQAPVHDQR